MPILNKGHSRRFHKHVAKWLEAFRLADWEVHYDFSTAYIERLADCAPEADVKKALIVLYDTWCIDPTDKALDQTACHEVLHVLLAQLMQLASDRYTTEKQLADAEQDVIRALERVLF